MWAAFKTTVTSAVASHVPTNTTSTHRTHSGVNTNLLKLMRHILDIFDLFRSDIFHTRRIYMYIYSKYNVLVKIKKLVANIHLI